RSGPSAVSAHVQPRSTYSTSNTGIGMPISHSRIQPTRPSWRRREASFRSGSIATSFRADGEQEPGQASSAERPRPEVAIVLTLGSTLMNVYEPIRSRARRKPDERTRRLPARPRRRGGGRDAPLVGGWRGRTPGGARPLDRRPRSASLRGDVRPALGGGA